MLVCRLVWGIIQTTKLFGSSSAIVRLMPLIATEPL